MDHTAEDYRAAAKRALAAGNVAAAEELARKGMELQRSAPKPKADGPSIWENVWGKGEIDTPGERLGATINDAGKSMLSGIARGTMGLLTLPQTAGDLLDKGVEKLTGIAPPQSVLPDSGKMANRAMRETLGSYEPETTAGRYAGTVGEFLPGAAFGGGVMPMVAAGLTSEAAGQATEGTPYEPYARFVGGIAGGAPFTAPGRSIPTSDALLRQGSKAIDNAVMSGSPVPSAVAQALAARTRARLIAEGRIRPSGKVQKGFVGARDAMNTLDDYASAPTPMTPRQAQGVRQDIGGVATAGGPEGRIGAIMGKEFDQNITEPYLPELKAANDIYGRGKRGEIVDLLIDRAGRQADASGTGGNSVNAIKQRSNELLKKIEDGKVHGFSDADVAALRAIISNPTVDKLRSLGFLAPSTGKLQSVLGLTALGGSAAAGGGATPLILGGMALSEGAKQVAEALIKKQINRLSETVRAGGSLPARSLSEAQKRIIAALLAESTANTALGPQ